MKKQLNIMYKIICLLFLIIFLFPNCILAEAQKQQCEEGGQIYTYVLDEDDETDGADVKYIDFELTGYTKEKLDSSDYNPSTFETNSIYGWKEYKKEDTNYVVLRSNDT